MSLWFLIITTLFIIYLKKYKECCVIFLVWFVFNSADFNFLIFKFQCLFSLNNFNEITSIKLINLFNNNLLNITLFLLVFCILVLKLKYKTQAKTKLCLISFLVFFSYIFCVGFLNEIQLSSSFNTALTNNLVLIHPLLTQYLYGLIFLLFFLYKSLFSRVVLTQPLRTRICIERIVGITVKIIFVSFFILYLGSLWAIQELSWGTWWNWDLIELIALIFFLVTFDVIHNSKKQKLIFQYYYYLNYITITACVLLLIRFDTTNSLHSFNIFKNIELYYDLFKEILLVIASQLLVVRKAFFLTTRSCEAITRRISLVLFNKLLSLITFFFFINIVMSLLLKLNLKLELASFQNLNTIMLISVVTVSLFLLNLDNLYNVLIKMAVITAILINTLYKLSKFRRNKDTVTTEINIIHTIVYLILIILIINNTVNFSQTSTKWLSPCESFLKKTLTRWESFCTCLGEVDGIRLYSSFFKIDFFLENINNQIKTNFLHIHANIQKNNFCLEYNSINEEHSLKYSYFNEYYILFLIMVVFFIFIYFYKLKIEIKDVF